MVRPSPSINIVSPISELPALPLCSAKLSPYPAENKIRLLEIYFAEYTAGLKADAEPVVHTSQCLAALEVMAKLWHLSAQYLLLLPSAARTGR